MKLYLVAVCSLFLASCEQRVVRGTEELIDGLTASNKVNNWPTIGSLKSWNISVNTFVNDVSSDSIQELYYRTCMKLDSLYPGEVRTYRWNDFMGYPKQATVLQLGNEVAGDSILITGVYEGNDSDGFYFSYSDGTFDASDKTEIGDWALGHILRVNHGRAEQGGADQPAAAVDSKSE